MAYFNFSRKFNKSIGTGHLSHVIESTKGGSRTHTSLRTQDFESSASAIPPLWRVDGASSALKRRRDSPGQIKDAEFTSVPPISASPTRDFLSVFLEMQGSPFLFGVVHLVFVPFSPLRAFHLWTAVGIGVAFMNRKDGKFTTVRE